MSSGLALEARLLIPRLGSQQRSSMQVTREERVHPLDRRTHVLFPVVEAGVGGSQSRTSAEVPSRRGAPAQSGGEQQVACEAQAVAGEGGFLSSRIPSVAAPRPRRIGGGFVLSARRVVLRRLHAVVAARCRATQRGKGLRRRADRERARRYTFYLPPRFRQHPSGVYRVSRKQITGFMPPLMVAFVGNTRRVRPCQAPSVGAVDCGRSPDTRRSCSRTRRVSSIARDRGVRPACSSRTTRLSQQSYQSPTDLIDVSRPESTAAVATLGMRRYRGRPESPCRPARRMSRTAASRPTASPWPSVSSAWTRRTPYVPRDSACPTDQLRQLCVTESPRQRRTIQPLVGPRYGDAQNAASDLDRKPFGGDYFDRRVRPFGSDFSFSSSVARR